MELIKIHSGSFGLNLSLEVMEIAKSSYYWLLNTPDTPLKKVKSKSGVEEAVK